MSTFSDNYDATIRTLETTLTDRIDGGAEFDFDRAGDVISIEFEDGERFIISPNSPVEQLWLSANYAGSRYNWSDEAKAWVNEKTCQFFLKDLETELSKKLGGSISE